MKISVNRSEFSKALAAVGRAVEARNLIPILGSFKLDAGGDRLTVTGTNLDIEATASITADGTDGVICVDAKILADIVKKGGSETVEIDTDGEKVVVKCGRGKYKLAPVAIDDGGFPTIDLPEFETSLKLDLEAVLSRVSFAQANDKVYNYLNGVYLAGIGGKLVAAATTRFVFARQVTDYDADFDGVIIPKRLVEMLPKGEVEISISRSVVKVVSENFEVVSKLLDGTFPDCDRIIPAGGELEIEADCKSVLGAVDRVSIATTDKHRVVRMNITPGALEVSSNSDIAEASDDIPIAYSGEPQTLSLNGSYLRDTLSAVGEGTLKIGYNGQFERPVFTADSAEGWSATIMPLRA